MKILPVYNEVKEIAATGKYRVLPVSCEILSDICTPIEALRILKNAPEYIGEYVKSMKDAMKQNNV